MILVYIILIPVAIVLWWILFKFFFNLSMKAVQKSEENKEKKQRQVTAKDTPRPSARSIIIAILLIAIGCGLVWYSYSWNHTQYSRTMSSTFLSNMSIYKDLTEIEHGFEFGYYTLGLHGFPTCFLLACGVVAISVKKSKNRIQKAKDEEAAAKEKARQEALFRKEHPYYEAELFFQDCRKAGATDLKTQADLARIQVVAKNSNLTKTNEELVKFYRIGQAYVERAEKAEQAKKEAELVAELRRQEKVQEAETRRYLSLHGTDKTIAIYTEALWAAEQELAKAEGRQAQLPKDAERLYQLTREREHDWALHGGIASGIAGGAAGLATAVSIQQKNADIRSRNAEMSRAIAELSVMSELATAKKIETLKNRVSRYQQKVDRAKLLLCDDTLPKEELLDRLEITVEKNNQTASGAVLLDVRIKNKEHSQIYGSVKAVVDGHIKAVISCDGQRMGEAVISLPEVGLTGKRVVSTVACTDIPKDTPYRVKFEAIDLWLQEVM